MASCSRCTRTLPPDATVCPFCGRKTHIAPEQSNPEQELIYKLRVLLRAEQQGWRVGSMVLVVLIVVFLAATALSFLSGEIVGTVVCGAITLYLGTAMLVNVLQFSRLEEFAEGLYIDCSSALERSEQNRYLFYGALFNPLAASRFAKTRKYILTNQENLLRIMQEQDRRYESTFRNDRFHREP